jgi:hypothetical protein
VIEAIVGREVIFRITTGSGVGSEHVLLKAEVVILEDVYKTLVVGDVQLEERAGLLPYSFPINMCDGRLSYH